jgi:positive regulator of sigma E activity
MEKKKRPSKFFAILFTVSALCSLITLLLMIVGGYTSTALILFQTLTVVLLVIGAVGKWYQYAQTYVKFEVERRLSQEEKE